MTGFGRRLVASVTAAALLASAAVPPVHAHTHAITSGSRNEIRSAVVHHQHDGHAHSHHHHDKTAAQVAGIRHVHANILFFDFTFPLNGEDDSDDSDCGVIGVIHKSPTLKARDPAGQVLLIGLLESPALQNLAPDTGRHGGRMICPGFVGRLCDTARLARSGVLIA